MEGEHFPPNTGRLRGASSATVCQWILPAWGKVTATTIIRGFAKADIIPGLTSNAIRSTKIGNSDSEDTSDIGLGSPSCLFPIRRTKSSKVSWKMKLLMKGLMNEK